MSLTVKDCLTLDARPETPGDIKKYRHQANQEPGKRYLHPGVADDYTIMGLDRKVFGMQSDGQNHTASELIRLKNPTTFQQIEKMKLEKNYKSTKREMLGAPIDRGTKLPDKFIKENKPFGMSSNTSKNSQLAKETMFPTSSDSTNSNNNNNNLPPSDYDESIYIRTHHAYPPGQQISRDYNWPIDPNETRFGRKPEKVANFGSSEDLSAVLSPPTIIPPDMIKENGDIIRPLRSPTSTTTTIRPLPDTLSSEFRYGKPSYSGTTKRRTAEDVISGKYMLSGVTSSELNIGKSMTPGLRNIDPKPGMIYGCPSSKVTTSVLLKADIDPTATAGILIHPTQTSYSSTSSSRSSKKDIFNELYTREQFISIYNKIDMNLSPDIVNEVFDIYYTQQQQQQQQQQQSINNKSMMPTTPKTPHHSILQSSSASSPSTRTMTTTTTTTTTTATTGSGGNPSSQAAIATKNNNTVGFHTTMMSSSSGSAASSKTPTYIINKYDKMTMNDFQYILNTLLVE